MSFHRPLAAALTALIVIGLPGAKAASPDEIERLWQLIDMPEVLEIMREEGLAYGATLNDDMLEGRGGNRFNRRIEAIYDLGRMEATARGAFEQGMARVDVAPALAFFSGEAGSKALAAELEARSAMLEAEVDRAARQAARDLQEDQPERFALIWRFVEVNDLLEANVAGAMNANYAFFRGLASAGALGPEMDEAGILEEVWSQEIQVRDDTESWLLGFLTLSYQGLTDEEIGAYVEFSASPAGKALNRELMGAFDRMFLEISQQLGEAVGEELIGADL